MTAVVNGAAAPATGAGEGAAAPPPPTAAELARPLTEPPYSAETLEAMRVFYQNRKKNHIDFFYTAGGDLETKEGAVARKRGKPLPGGVVQLKRFIALTPEERGALEEMRAEVLSEVEERYEQAIQVLRDAWTAYRGAEAAGGAAGGQLRAVVAANQRVAEIDIERNAIRSAVRDITGIDNPVTRDILLSQVYEVRKMFSNGDPFGKELYRLMYYDFKAEQSHGRYVPDEEVEGAAAAAEEEGGVRPDEAAFRKVLKDGRIARTFYDGDSPINGFMSPIWPVKVQVRETQYNFPLQAYEAERAKELGKDALRSAIMKATTGRTVRLLTRKEDKHPADVRKLWMEIYTAVFQQHPELKEKLLATGTDSLVYADPHEGPSGIGAEESSPALLDPSKWKGENVVGVVLETLRTRLREETMEEAPSGPVKETAITEEQVQANRVGAIINAARRRNGGF